MIANSPLPFEQPRRLVGQRVADAFRRRLVDEEVARVGLGVGVPGQHLDAALARLAQHGRDAGAVLDRDRDRVDLARDPVLDELVLLRGVEAGRPVPDQLDAELLRRFLGAGAAADEVRDRPSPSASSRSTGRRPPAPAAARRRPAGATAARPAAASGRARRWCGDDQRAGEDRARTGRRPDCSSRRIPPEYGVERRVRARPRAQRDRSRSSRAAARRSGRRSAPTAARRAAGRSAGPTIANSPSSVPHSVPRPPKTDVPPSTTAVIASSS